MSDTEQKELSQNVLSKEKRDYLLPASILVAGVLISGSIVYMVGSQGVTRPGGTAQLTGGAEESPAPAGIAATERDVILGDPNAPVTIVEYGDYQCPFCARFYKTVEQSIRDEYIKTGKVRMVFRNFQFLGPESVLAAEAAECAKDQQQFWAYHDAIYDEELIDGKEHNGNLNRDLFIKIARTLQLDETAFATCFDSHKYAAQVQADLEAGQAAQINSTPTTFVNSTRLLGALPYAQFKEAIEKALQ
ncbi:MAG: hypothetical protein RIQ56_131 [Candidatus Parcubacteria bacterium]|jgi:protein-disulfide isomerase